MAMQQCPSAGHFYDAAKHSSCPFCGVGGIEMPKTRGVSVDAATGSQDEGRTRAARVASDSSRTQGFYQASMGIEPVVGWLVAIEGPHCGRDFRLHSEKNFIGREPDNDVCLSGDSRISGSRHAVISFDPRKGLFKLRGGDGRGLTYLNDDEVDNAAALTPYDEIVVGDTKLVFVPLCGERFQWPTD